jgi:peptidyl-prolyl cis-trans isomerase C
VKVNLAILKYVLVGTVLGLLIITGMSPSLYAQGDKVLARIGEQAITEADLNKLVNAIPERMRQLYLSPEGQSQTLDYIVNVYIMATQAEKEGLDKDPSFATIMNFTKKDLLARLYLEKTSKSLSEPTEKDARDFYDKNKDQFATPESVHLRHILVNSEKEAQDVLNKLKKGESFADLAGKVSTCPTKVSGGDLDWLPRGRLVKELEDVAFTMNKGQITGPIKTKFGYHVLLLEDKKPASQSSFDEVKEYILEQLRYQQQQDHYQKVTDSLRKTMNVKITAPAQPVPTVPQAQPLAPAGPTAQPAPPAAPSGGPR